MVLHILGSGSMFTKDTYNMISTYFNSLEEEHCFVGKFPNEGAYAGNGCKVYQSKSIQMLIALYKSDYIIVHGLINKLVVILLVFQPWLHKKCNWIIWGGDIYIHKKEKKTLAEKLIEHMKRIIAPRFPYISTLADGDYALAKEWYGIKGKQIPIIYPVPASNEELLNELSERKHSGKDCINVIVGNSATTTNQHFDALNWLSKFQDKKIQVYLPLNYGTGNFEEYAQEVIDYSAELFGDRIHPIREKMPGEEYLKFLNDMDVGLFNNNRQQAMGNISQLILCGAKVYIRTDTPMWDHFNSLGCKLYDIESIQLMSSVDELVEQDSFIKASNQSIIRYRHDMNTKVQMWKHMLDVMHGVS